MSEWPQYATVKTRKKLRETILVSPHDLTKELYEALDFENRAAGVPEREARAHSRTLKALKHYEKEVGK